MRRAILAAGIAVIVSTSAVATPIQLSVIGDPYEQDFNTLASTGTSSALPVGWSMNQASYLAVTGSSTTFGIKSYGTTSSSDRALGSLSDGGLLIFGAEFSNQTGLPINTLDVGYTGEQWRRGANTATDSLFFEYSLDATSLTTGTWVAVSTLNFISPQTGTTAATLNGNLNANRSFLGTSIPSLNIGVSTNFWFRWRDVGISGSDHGLAVDDFQLVPSSNVIPEPSTLAVFGAGLLGLGALRRRRKAKA